MLLVTVIIALAIICVIERRASRSKIKELENSQKKIIEEGFFFAWVTGRSGYANEFAGNIKKNPNTDIEFLRKELINNLFGLWMLHESGWNARELRLVTNHPSSAGRHLKIAHKSLKILEVETVDEFYQLTKQDRSRNGDGELYDKSTPNYRSLREFFAEALKPEYVNPF